MIEIETTTRRVNFEKFIDYVQENYRIKLNDIDYEILHEIANTYSREEIKLALDYCKEKKTDSLIYLQQALKQKYYQNEKISIVPKWLDMEIKAEPLTEEDKEWVRYFYKKYCDTEEEYKQRLIENDLV